VPAFFIGENKIDLELGKSKMVSDVLSLRRHLNIFRDELQRWFKILEQTEPLDQFLILRAIATEITEFRRDCATLFERTAEATNQINNTYRNMGGVRTLPQPPRKELRNELDKPVFEHIKCARNQVTAHRFTDRDGNYITKEATINHYNAISAHKLKEAFSIADQYLDKMGEWISVNRNLLEN
jgi:hypothetical protein